MNMKHHYILPYSLCLTTNRVGLGFRSSIVRAIGDSDLLMEKNDHGVPME
jgi:hypothetical protein